MSPPSAASPSGSTDFYIGYRPTAPPAVKRLLRPAVTLLLLATIALAFLLASLQKPFDPGIFEYGVVRDFEGVVVEGPHPELLVDRPGEASTASTRSRYLLVAPGKLGAGRLVHGMDGQRVRLQASLVFRDTETMLEVVPGSVEPSPSQATQAALPTVMEDLGLHTLRGEVVDAKCFLGVMKPGREKPHRACAARCISGGVPPVLAVETAAGERSYLLLLDAEGRTVNKRILRFVAEPIEVAGHLQRRGDRLLLLADLESIRRASE